MNSTMTVTVDTKKDDCYSVLQSLCYTPILWATYVLLVLSFPLRARHFAVSTFEADAMRLQMMYHEERGNYQLTVIISIK